MADNTVGELKIVLNFDGKSVEASAKKVGSSLESTTSKSTKKVEKDFDTLKTAAGAAVTNITTKLVDASLNLGKSFISVGSDFSAAMSEVSAISGASGSELEMLEQTARNFGASTQFSASEAANALKYMSLAGWDANQSSSALGGVLDLAAASGMDLGAASDMVTDYLSAFNMTAEQSTYFADMLAYAQNNSNTTAQDLGEAYKNCAASLNAAGQDVETTTSLLAMMANQGLKGSEAGTALNAVMRDMTAKMKNGSIAIGDTKVQVMDANGDFRDMTDILKDVENATNGMGEAQRATALASTFTADSTKGLNMILNAGVGTAANFEDALRNSQGAAKAAGDEMNNNLGGDVKTLNSAFQEFQLVLYEKVEPALRQIVQVGTDVVIWLSENSDVVIGIAIAVGGVFGTMFAVNKIIKAVNSVKKAFSTVQSVLSKHKDTITDVAKKQKTATNDFNRSSKIIGNSSKSLSTKLQDSIKNITSTITTAIQSLGQIMGSVANAVMEPIKIVLKGVGEAVAGFFQALANPQILIGVVVFTAAAAGIAAAILLIGGAIGIVTPGLSNFLNTVLIPLGAFLAGTLIVVLGAITDTIIRLTNEAIIPFGTFVRDTIVVVVNTLTDAIIRLTNEAIIPLIDKVMEFFDWLLAKVGEVVNGITSALGGIASWINQNVIQPIANFFAGLWEGIKRGVEGVKTTISNIFSTIAGIIKAPINGIIGAINGVIGTINSITVPDWVPVIGGASANIPTIPMLAQGGYASTGTPAIFGEAGAEVALPLERNTGNWSGLLAAALAEEFDEMPNGTANKAVQITQYNDFDQDMTPEQIEEIMARSIRMANV